MKIKNTLLFSTIILLIGLTPMISVSAKSLQGTLYSRPSSAPVIDGIINEAVWDSGIKQEFKLHSHSNASDIIRLEAISIYTASNNLYIGLNLYDSAFAYSEVLVMFFKINNSGDFVQFLSPLNPYIQNGNDVKGIFLGTNATQDGFTEDSQFNGYFDSSYGGTNDMDGKCHIESSDLITIEIEIPFNTSDIPSACDMDIDVGDKFEIFFWYIDNTGYYSGYLFNTTNYEYGILDIGGSPPTKGFDIAKTTLILSTIITNIIIIAKFKKKKK